MTEDLLALEKIIISMMTLDLISVKQKIVKNDCRQNV